jgi:peroxiredoxin
MTGQRLVLLFLISGALCVGSACRGGSPGSSEPPPPEYTLSGTVTLEGEGLAGVDVLLSGATSGSARTDGRGAYTFANVSGDRFLITPRLEGFTFEPASYNVGGATRTDLDFAATEESGDSLIGRTAPDFAAVDQNGLPVALSSYLGKVIFIDFCADWCGSCRVEASKLEALSQKYKDRGLQVLTVLIDGSAAAWAAEYGLTFPVIEDTTGAISAPYMTGWVPVNVIIDRDMIIRFHQAIDYDEALFTSIIESYL